MMAIKHIMDAALFFKNIRTAKPPTIKPNLSYLQLESGGSIPIHYYPPAYLRCILGNSFCFQLGSLFYGCCIRQ